MPIRKSMPMVAINTEHNGTFGPAWRTKIAYTRVSDPEFIQTLRTTGSARSANRPTTVR